MAPGDVKNREDLLIHIPSLIANFLRPKTKWKRAPTLCQLLSSEPHHHTQPLPTPANTRIAGQSPGGTVVYQNGPKKWVQSYPHSRRRQMENCVPNLLRTIQIPGNAVRINKRPLHSSRYDEPHILQHARPRSNSYMDEILIYTKTRTEHDDIVRQTLKRLQRNGLAVVADKCVWRATEVEFLGYVLTRDSVKMVQNKVEAVLSWKTPDSLTEVQAFLGFANFYQWFIRDYSQIGRPLTELTKKTKK